jgi:hypothetical protein
VSVTVLSDTRRKAAHGKHRCGYCRQPIAAGEVYDDTRCADNGTAWTWRSHLRCQAFAQKVVDPFDWQDGVDAVSFAYYVEDNKALAVEMGVTS